MSIILNTIISLILLLLWTHSLISIILPNSVTEVGDYAFYNNAYCEKVILSRGMKRINYCTLNQVGSAAWMDYMPGPGIAEPEQNLEISIPSSITEINEMAFDINQRVGRIYYEGSKKQWDSIRIFYNNNEWD